MVHLCTNPASQTVKNLSTYVNVLNAMYPKLSISLLTLAVPQGVAFGREVCDFVCAEWKVPRNMCFITASNSRKFSIADLGGVRIITR